MTPQRLNRGIQRELDRLQAQGLLAPDARARIGEQYPVTPWNRRVLSRWFTILGMVSMGAGVLVLLRHLGSALRLTEVGCAVGFVGLLLLGRRLRARAPKAAAAAELGAGFALQGLTVALAIDLSTGSDDWPSLVGLCTLELLLLAYALGNRLVLIHALVNLFVWFGGATGYISGWGAYWLRMTYPVRFLAAGVVTLGVAWAHAHLLAGPRQAFARVYAHFGLLIVHLALWFLALFGLFTTRVRWEGTEGERLLFTLVWAGTAVGCLVAGARSGLRLLRGYGLTFLIINVYTFYFQFVVANSAGAWFLHLLLTGGSLVALGIWLERRLRLRRAVN